jgi:signal transduction histidine kinase
MRVPAVTSKHLVLGVRAGLLLLGLTLTVVELDDRQNAGVLALALVSVAATVPVRRAVLRRLQPVGESAFACGAMLLIEPLPEALLPYLIAPALAAGLVGGAVAAVTTSGMAALVLLLGRMLGTELLGSSDYYAAVAQWTLITLAVGLLASWVRRLQSTQGEPENAAYAAAYRLISQLRLVSRQLSGGLDPVSLAQSMLEQLRDTTRFDTGAVYVRSGGGRLTPVAFSGAERLEWRADSQVFEDVWVSAEAATLEQPLSPGSTGFAAVLPLQVGLRTVGLVGLERAGESYSPDELSAAEDVTAEQALRLETALLFSEVRSIATVEERRRLAREIHDGIAQELASLGYVIDDLTAQARYLPDLDRDLRSLRSELTRIISELRLSIFDLRSDVQQTTGLGTALSDYVRQVGAGAGFTVHLVLDEAPTRLPIDVETELLRIAQEAVTNARKHAKAQNLWVTCRVDPPHAHLQVEDDGRGLGRARVDSFGLEVMRERAQRVGGALEVGEREGGGTRVEVRIGSADRAHR